jgi:hypothetical protein
MKLKLGVLVNAQTALNDLASRQLIAKTAFRIGRNLKVIGNEIELYEKQRVELAKKYGTLDAERNQYKFEKTVDGKSVPDKESGEKFIAELNDLLTTEIEIAITPIPLSDLADVKMSAGDMTMLDWLIEDAPTPAS